MNADLLAMLGGAGLHGGSNSRRENEAKSILSFKAGKMSTTLQPNGKYLVTPDPRRGSLALTWTSSSSGSSSGSAGIVKLEWTDRRTRTVVDTFTIFPQEECTYSRVDTGREEDRVYLFVCSNKRHFYWMQDKLEDGGDDDNAVKMNTYMSDATEAAKAAGEEPTTPTATTTSTRTTTTTTTTHNNNNNSISGRTNNASGLDMSGLGSGGLDNAALMQVMQGLGSSDNNNNDNATETPTTGTSTSTTEAAPPQGQVDALSNILENLGMPQPTGTPSTTTNAETTTTTSTNSNLSTPAPVSGGAGSLVGNGNGGTLTLADLQGAMAGLATTSPPSNNNSNNSSSAAPLSEVLSPEAVLETGILQDEGIKAKLMELLPEGQRSEQYLEQNLRSPPVAQCLKTLTAALVEDPDALPTILANFQLPSTPTTNTTSNPIQEFLDAVLASVQQEQTKNNNNDSEMKEE
eukprot:CAMPEP_0197823984 /NCGR_PEP_ID=MMETSP1437-20131217/1295_1 /TAXON_ID=49252 ORGANISM="Eucampia antarctica, Strain CCMP1452" /NCGR_SAMPLE_ID=MMETSP1437 /ASSEMBLY_ACC=CAM_ASM_001096 /LENGTH=461 /DNA_ID=CAMNT_0043423427 /DNA_START=214 /DNA_END=1599 /DNA_ORIENTATION=+